MATEPFDKNESPTDRTPLERAIDQLHEAGRFLTQVASAGGPLSGNAMEMARRCLVEGDIASIVAKALRASPSASATKNDPVLRLHGMIEELAMRFKGYLPWPEEKRDAVVRGHEKAIEDIIKKADELAIARLTQGCCGKFTIRGHCSAACPHRPLSEEEIRAAIRNSPLSHEGTNNAAPQAADALSTVSPRQARTVGDGYAEAPAGAAPSTALPSVAHTDHPLRHFDRTCPACIKEGEERFEHWSPSSIEQTCSDAKEAGYGCFRAVRAERLQREAEEKLAALSARRPTYEDITGAVARGWCSPLNEHKVMDPELAFAISVQVAALLGLGSSPDGRKAT